MPEHVYRVLVRGRFDKLDPPAREKLRRNADQQDVLNASFTEEGTLVYNESIVAFTFRLVVRVEFDDKAEQRAQDAAEERLMARFDEIGCGYRDLRFGVTDMDSMKINRPVRERR
ncbi:hypothetical protein CcI156_22105 [Frankia sp. CcI156]|uniref:DUF6204 family protein n=1 Tax=unclassified Frankia TaxID=2632575 RepID=UPI0003D06EF8|nr:MULTISPECIES: DUF6204 family protein [unclassified Frankia]ESZ99885.1 hypothetical protein CcI6DRAFT_04702 [Frankia sp. CcI6]KEZ34382.1 hypothetical protein CEDDRAFT_04269 [Frankia sp. CeD]KFB02544.1 hypothetical protein ALLO2DRAFT_04713 [Frankia sp. Allo2]OFB38343.1 hypothetical protein Manayef4_21750 [Frankia sp. CgIM4]OHV48787.1 hypothetical protein CgIS1_21690 [Frankia sp. CgIS1]